MKWVPPTTLRPGAAGCGFHRAQNTLWLGFCQTRESVPREASLWRSLLLLFFQETHNERRDVELLFPPPPSVLQTHQNVLKKEITPVHMR